MLWGGPLYPHVAYTIFHHTRAENTTFAFRRRERKWDFRAGYGKNKLNNKRTVVNTIFYLVDYPDYIIIVRIWKIICIFTKSFILVRGLS